jgi:phosphoribosylaminoimidazole (AIR) synthetase
MNREGVRGFAHITGGGLTDNVPRIFDETALAAEFDDAALALPPLFQWLQRIGGLSTEEMRRTFNCGVGGVLVVAPQIVESCVSALNASGEKARVIGRVVGA